MLTTDERLSTPEEKMFFVNQGEKLIHKEVGNVGGSHR
jgi:hypothetical protein